MAVRRLRRRVTVLLLFAALAAASVVARADTLGYVLVITNAALWLPEFIAAPRVGASITVPERGQARIHSGLAVLGATVVFSAALLTSR